ncbi:MAG: universal stress protein [Bacteroidetes bacterium]|nr:universal stress protein [Bacteroidota bacterium]
MENILLAVDGTKLNMNTVDFACYIAKLTQSTLNCFLIENLAGENKPVLKQLYALPYVETITTTDIPENKERVKSCDQNIALFEEACTNRGVNHHVHIDKFARVKDVIAESRFADIIIVDPALSFNDEREAVPTKFVRDILAEAECPVLIAPYSFDGVKEILFTYDGSKSAAFAIKQFAHLFPSLKGNKITVLQVDEDKDEQTRENDKLKRLMRAHFSDVDYKHLQGKASDELFGYLLEKENVFVILGAYGRSTLSNLFKHSTADLLVKTVNLPFFIAHI